MIYPSKDELDLARHIAGMLKRQAMVEEDRLHVVLALMLGSIAQCYPNPQTTLDEAIDLAREVRERLEKDYGRLPADNDIH